MMSLFDLYRKDPTQQTKGLLGGYSPNPEIIDRATLLPIGQYEDGSMTLAWPGFLKDAWDGGVKSLVGQEGAPLFDDGGQYVSGANYTPADTINFASAGPISGIAGRAAGAIPRGALGSGGSDMLSGPKGIRAFHGSPHDFDKFEMSKIGTGEGAQAYGHGLYFAENEGVAKNYKVHGATPRQDIAQPTYDGKRWHELTVDAAGDPEPKYFAAEAVSRFKGDRTKAETTLMRDDAEFGNETSVYRDAASILRRGDTLPLIGHADHSSGRLYEVNIKAEPEQFLDWDKPLAEQSEVVRNALTPLARQEAERALKKRAWNNARSDVQLRELLGKEPAPREPLPSVDEYMMRMWGNEIGPGNEAALREAGIPGIRYLDAGSRGAGEGSHNYVVFDENLIDILRKYGLLGTAGLGASMFGQGEEANATGLLGR